VCSSDLYDSLIADKLTEILWSKEKLSYSKLRLAVNEAVKFEKDRMRKKKRDSDKNNYYVPSNSKISTTLMQLVELKWIDQKEDTLSKKTLKEVYYSLSETGKFGYHIGLKPDERYRLSDAYQTVLRTATLDILSMQRYTNKGGHPQIKIKVIKGTSKDDILYKRDHVASGNFDHRNFKEEEIERVFTEALNEASIQKRLINNEIRYVINDVLEEFITKCWRTLYAYIFLIIQNIIKLKRFSSNDPAYKKIHEWLIYMHEEEYILALIEYRKDERNKYRKSKDKQKLLKDTKSALANVIEERDKIMTVYIIDNNSETATKYKNLMKSVLHYTYPEYIIDAIKNILIDLSIK